MGRLFDEFQEDFSRGMDDSRAANRYPRNAAKLIQNARIESDGTVSRRDGTRRLHLAALFAGIGYGATMFEAANGDVQEIAIFGTKAYMSDDNWLTSAEVATGLREDYYDFATMRVGSTNYLFMANGDTTVKRWDGTTWDTLPNVPSGVKYIEVFNSRLAVTGHSGVLVQLSKVADPTIWTGAGGALTVSILTYDGDPPNGLFTAGPHLLVFERHNTSYLDGFGEQTLIVAQGATGFSRSVGCIAFRTIVAVGDEEVCWLSARGVEYYSPRTGIHLLSRQIDTFMSENVDFTTIVDNPGRPTACYDAFRQDYLCAVPTGGLRNSRTIVVNLYQRGTGWLGAPSIDLKAYSAGTELLFGGDADGYMEIEAAGYRLRVDANGYTTFGTEAGGADPILEDADGYLDAVTDDALPATLYIGPSVEGGLVVHSAGYDGFVRQHFGADFDKDDELVTPSGGEDIEMVLVPRPFVMGAPRRRKRVRAVHVSAINETSATLTVAVRAGGTLGATTTLTVPLTQYSQAKRERAMVTGLDDAPQVELHTTARTRIALVGVSAEVTREPV